MAHVRLDSHNNLRDFLRIRDEDLHHTAAASTATGTRRSNCSPVHSTRTLMDIIRQDPIPTVGCRRSWRQLRDRIRLRRSTQLTSNLNPGESSFSSSRVPSFREEATGRRPEQPARTSLMALLEKDWQLRSAHTLRQEMEEEEEEEEEEERETVVGAAAGWVEEEEEENNSENQNQNQNQHNKNNNNCCCVCMVRQKGAALIPCGHTFCRVCSREVWLHRGHCPLCNNTILEILHIF